MPQFVRKYHYYLYLSFCILAPFLFINSDFAVASNERNINTLVSATVTTTLISSASGNTICPGDEISFTVSPDDADQYSFYINGIIKQGPSATSNFAPKSPFFDGDKIMVILTKNGETGTSSLTVNENKIEDAGSIFFGSQSNTLSQISLCYGSNSVSLESSKSATVNGVELSNSDNRYQWMSSVDNINWVPIIGATQRNFSIIGLTTTTFFRRDVINNLNGTVCRASSNVLLVRIEVELIGGTVSPVTQTLCKNDNSQKLSVENGVSGKTVTYQWQHSSDGTVFENIRFNGNSSQLFPGTVTQTTYFRRLTNALGGRCNSVSSSVHKIEVIGLDAGVFDPAHSTTLCYGDKPNMFSTGPLKSGQPGRKASSDNGLLKFQWEKSIDKGNSWQVINNASQPTYSPSVLTKSTWYRRKVTAVLNGVSCEEVTKNKIKIDVLPPIGKGSIHSDQDICEGELPNPLEIRNLPLDPGISYTLQWQYAIKSFPFEDLVGQTRYQLQFREGDPWVPKETTRYRVKISDRSRPNCDPVYSDVVSITVRPLQKILQVGGPVDSQTICVGDDIIPVVLQYEGSAQDLDLTDVLSNGLTYTRNQAEKKYTIAGNVKKTTVLIIKTTGSDCLQDELEYKIEVKSDLYNTIPEFIYADGFKTHQPDGQLTKFQTCEGTKTTQFTANFVDPEKTRYTVFEWELVGPKNAGSIDTKSGLMTWNITTPAFSGKTEFRVRSVGCGVTSAWRNFDVEVIANQFPPDVVTKITDPIDIEIITDEKGYTTAGVPKCRVSNTTPDTQFYIDEGKAIPKLGQAVWTIATIKAGNPTVTTAGTIDAVTGRVKWNPGFWGTANIYAHPSNCAGTNDPRKGTPDMNLAQKYKVQIPEGPPPIEDISVDSTLPGNTLPQCPVQSGQTTKFVSNYSYAGLANPIEWSIDNTQAGTIHPTQGILTWKEGFFGEVRITAQSVKLESSCEVSSESILLVVPKAPTINLVSGFNTNNAKLCKGSSLSPIVYEIEGAATGVKDSGLPAGLKGEYSIDYQTIDLLFKGTSSTKGEQYKVAIAERNYYYTTQAAGETASHVAGKFFQLFQSDPNVSATLKNNQISLKAKKAGFVFTVTPHRYGNSPQLSFSTTETVKEKREFKITGTPTASPGIYPYTLNTISVGGGCAIATATGTIVIDPDSEIMLSPGSQDGHTVCNNSPITNVVYDISNAEGAYVETPSAVAVFTEGLPNGVNYTFTGKQIIISGTPQVSITETATFIFTVKTRDVVSGCKPASLTGRITVAPNLEVSLSSRPNTQNQQVCVGEPIEKIEYLLSQAASENTGNFSYDFSNLPKGVRANNDQKNRIIIEGTPDPEPPIETTTTYSYNISAKNCKGITQTITGTLTLYPRPYLELLSAKGTDDQTLCTDESLTPIVYQIQGASGYDFSVTPSARWMIPLFNPAKNRVTVTGKPNIKLRRKTIYNYSITPRLSKYNCTDFKSIQGKVTLLPEQQLELTQESGLMDQEICEGGTFKPLRFDFIGAATGATDSGLPPGLGGNVETSIQKTKIQIGTGNILAAGEKYTVQLNNTSYTYTTKTADIGPSTNLSSALRKLIDDAPDYNCSLDGNNLIITATVSGVSFDTQLKPERNNVSLGPVIEIDPPSQYVIGGKILFEKDLPKTYTYVISTTGFDCKSIAVTGTLKINPKSTIELKSPALSDQQVVCDATKIEDIVYQLGGGAKGASLLGQPPGISGNFDPQTGEFIISGRVESGVTTKTIYNLSITTISNGYLCEEETVLAKIEVSPKETLKLISPPETAAQSLCGTESGTQITPIKYQYGGGANGYVILGLPDGLVAKPDPDKKVITISGTVSQVSKITDYPYTISTTGSNCGSVSATGLIRVLPLPKLILKSTPETTQQTGFNAVCDGVAIDPIVYEIGAGEQPLADGLPFGLTYSINGNIFTISGKTNLGNKEPKTFVFTIETKGGSCTLPVKLEGKIQVNPLPTVDKDYILANDVTHVSCFGGNDGAITIPPDSPAFDLRVLGKQNGIRQTDRLSLSNDPNLSDVINIRVDGIDYQHIVVPSTPGGPPQNISEVTQAVVQKINGATGKDQSNVRALYEAPSQILLSAKTPGIAFTVTATVAPPSSPVSVITKNITPNLASKYSFQWTGPNGFSSKQLSISNLIAGSYKLKVKINDCEGEETTFEIKEPAEIKIDFVSCNQALQGTISGGKGPYTVQLTDTDGKVIETKTVNEEVIYTNLTPGKKHLVKIKGISCDQETVVSVDIPLPLQFEKTKVEIVHDFCNQNPEIGNGYIKLGGGALGEAFSGGSNQFTYRWEGPNNQVFNTREIYNLVPGNYTVTVKDKKLGCTQSQSFEINAVDPLVIATDSNNKFDANGEINLNCYGDADASISTVISGGSGNYSTSWKKDNTVLPNRNTPAVGGLSAGVYELIVTDNPPPGLSPQPEPCRVSRKFVVNEPEKFSVLMSKTSSRTVCSGDKTAISFEIFGGIPPFEFDLNGTTYTRTERKFLIENLDPLTTGSTYKAIFNDANGCSPEKQPDPITFPKLTKVEFRAVVETIDCNNGKLGSIKISTINNTQILDPTLTQIQWIGASLNQYDTWENSKGVLENISQPGNYLVKISDKNGCELFNQQFNISALGSPLTLNRVDVTQKGCGSTSNKIQLDITGGKPPYQIIWQQFKAQEVNITPPPPTGNGSATTTTSTTASQTTQTVLKYDWVTLGQLSNQALISDLEVGSYRAIVSDQSNIINKDVGCGGTITSRNISIGEADVQLKNFKINTSKACSTANDDASIAFNLQNNLYDQFNNKAQLTIKLDNIVLDRQNGDFEGPGADGLYVIKNIKIGKHSLNITNNVNPSCELIFPFEIEESAPIVYTGLTNINLEDCEEFTTLNVSGAQISGGKPYEINVVLTYNFEWIYTDKDGNETKFVGAEILQAFPGKYTLNIYDANNCSTESPIIITVSSNKSPDTPIQVIGALTDPKDPNATALVKVIPPRCDGQNSFGEIGIQITGGIAPYTIKWYKENSTTSGVSQTTSNYIELTNYQNATLLNKLESGRYRVVIEATGDLCTDEQTKYNYYTEDLVVPANQDFYIVDGPSPRFDNLCKGEAGELLISVFDRKGEGLTFYYNQSIVRAEKVESGSLEDVYVLSIDQPVNKAILKISNSNDCSIEKEVNILELGDPNFEYTSPAYRANGKTGVLAREEVTFKNTSSEPYLSSIWSFGDGTELQRLDRVGESTNQIRHAFGISGTYFVTLRVRNSIGCEKEITKKITVGKGFNILAPNVFTPNKDGINDRFRVVFSGFSSLSFNVFDNHGNLLYNEKVSELDPQNPKGLMLEGWDGDNGSSETPYFIYAIEGVLLADPETTIERSGTFSLLR